MKNNYIVYRHSVGKAFTALFLLMMLFSCKKDIDTSLPGDHESAAVNFYITSDVMQTAYGQTRGTTAAYLDSVYKADLIYSTNSKYPVFAFGFLANPEFPQVSDNSSINLFTYSRYKAGTHRLLFTDVTNTVVADTISALQSDSWNTIYLADKPQQSGADAAYTVLAVTEPRETPEGKTGVRFVHLSPDAGPLDCKELHADGTPATNTIATVRFREASEYTWLTQERAANGLLRLQIRNSQMSITTAVPARPGRSFVVIIRGFANNTIRRVTTGKNTDGSLRQDNISVNAAIRAEVRTSY